MIMSETVTAFEPLEAFAGTEAEPDETVITQQYVAHDGEMYAAEDNDEDGTSSEIGFAEGLSDELTEQHQAALAQALSDEEGTTEFRGITGHTDTTEIFVISVYRQVGETPEGWAIIEVTSRTEERQIQPEFEDEPAEDFYGDTHEDYTDDSDDFFDSAFELPPLPVVAVTPLESLPPTPEPEPPAIRPVQEPERAMVLSSLPEAINPAETLTVSPEQPVNFPDPVTFELPPVATYEFLPEPPVVVATGEIISSTETIKPPSKPELASSPIKAIKRTEPTPQAPPPTDQTEPTQKFKPESAATPPESSDIDVPATEPVKVVNPVMHPALEVRISENRIVTQTPVEKPRPVIEATQTPQAGQFDEPLATEAPIIETAKPQSLAETTPPSVALSELSAIDVPATEPAKVSNPDVRISENRIVTQSLVETPVIETTNTLQTAPVASTPFVEPLAAVVLQATELSPPPAEVFAAQELSIEPSTPAVQAEVPAIATDEIAQPIKSAVESTAPLSETIHQLAEVSPAKNPPVEAKVPTVEVNMIRAEAIAPAEAAEDVQATRTVETSPGFQVAAVNPVITAPDTVPAVSAPRPSAEVLTPAIEADTLTVEANSVLQVTGETSRPADIEPNASTTESDPATINFEAGRIDDRRSENMTPLNELLGSKVDEGSYNDDEDAIVIEFQPSSRRGTQRPARKIRTAAA
jgi:hypothetical protein